MVSGSVSRSFDINPYSYAMNTSRTLDPDQIYTRNYAPFNIFDELNNNYIDLGISDMKYQGEVTLKPIMGLEFHAMGAYRTVNSIKAFHLGDRTWLRPIAQAWTIPNKMYSNPYLYQDPDEPTHCPFL